jgi:hypothetical protein
MRQFWHESTTGESWNLLQKLAKSRNFVLIGGWAAYLHTRTQKSKDIDIVVDFEELRHLDAEFRLLKNERLGKYEIKQDDVDVDVYVPKLSRLAYPPEKLLKKYEIIDGIMVAGVSQLLLLKLGAYADRKGSSKGEKDAIDIVSLLYGTEFDKADFEKAAKDASVERPVEMLKEIVSQFPGSSLEFVGAGFLEFKKWRGGFLKRLA